MIRTKEELNLRYLEDPEKLYEDLRKRRVARNEEITQAVIDLGDPFLAFSYSYEVFLRSDPELRAVACQDPWQAYCYARYIDRRPRDDTREAAGRSYHGYFSYDNWEYWWRKDEEGRRSSKPKKN